MRVDVAGRTALLHIFAKSSNASPVGLTLARDGFLYGPSGSVASTDIYDLPRSSPIDGMNSAFIQASDGALYGTTGYICDTSSCGPGVVYRIRTNGSGLRVVHDFGSGPGIDPNGLVQAEDGMLYGTTSEGGSCYAPSGYGCGIRYRVALDGSRFSVLHQFSGGSDGGFPSAPTEPVRGFLYGTTFGNSFGGATVDSTIYTIAVGGQGYHTLVHVPPSGKLTFVNGP